MGFYLNIISFLIILSSSSINKITLANTGPPIKTVTNEYITKICSKSSNRLLCFYLLRNLIGQPIASVTLATLATRPINNAETLARATHKMIGGMYTSLVNPKSEVRERYRKCISGYSTAIQNLASARGSMQTVGSKKLVKSYVTSAANLVKSCDKNFVKPPQIPLDLKNANQKFKDLCSVIIAVCN